MGLKVKYQRKFERVLEPCAKNLQALLTSHLVGVKRVDRISVRAKSLDRFLEKAAKRRDGQKLYSDPLNQIQDQIGARVIVFYSSDVQPVIDKIKEYFSYIEQLWKEPKSDKEFGYFGRHLMLALPADCVPDGIAIDEAPGFFELQVRTLFQHAWSEAEHDLAYKPKKTLTAEHNRRFAFTAAQAWGADLLFEELHAELGEGTTPSENEEAPPVAARPTVKPRKTKAGKK